MFHHSKLGKQEHVAESQLITNIDSALKSMLWLFAILIQQSLDNFYIKCITD